MEQKILIRSSFVSSDAESLQKAVTEKIEKLIDQRLRQTTDAQQR
ncbi:MAG TPA: hypothetical protein P5191_02930 [Ruminococcus sp.]|nr:hypothetical protein [Ruminococcus sp.]